MIRGVEALDRLSPQVAERLIKHQEQIYQLHETLNTLRLDKQNALVRRLVMKQQDGTLGQATADVPETEETAVNDPDAEKVTFGDTTTYNVSQPAPAVVQETRAPAIWPYVLAAALGGSGLGAALMAVPALLKASPTVVTTPSQITDTDTDTNYDLTFKEDPTP